jgi:hypothetical protein
MSWQLGANLAHDGVHEVMYEPCVDIMVAAGGIYLHV